MSKKQIQTYSKRHLICEACRRQPAGPPHHIKSRGAGGGDDNTNLLALCGVCHARIHQEGDRRFILHYPHLSAKISNVKFKVKQETIF